MMLNSSHDMLALIIEINARHLPRILGKLYRRSFGVALSGSVANARILQMLSDDHRRAYFTVRQLHARYSRGDYRHSERELKLAVLLCNFLLHQHAILSGTQYAPWQPNMASMSRPNPIPQGSYESLQQRLLSA